jgi:hypothetical protein
MYVRITTFRLDGITAAEYKHHVDAIAPGFDEWPGLLAKVWIADEAANTFGGVYIFADKDAADRSRDTDLHRSLASPAFADVSIREFDVLEEPTAITASVFAPAHAG